MKKQLYFIIFILISLKAFSQDLSIITSNLPENTNSILLSGDINNDGLMDVFVSGINLGTKYAALYQNMADSTFLNLGISIPTLDDAAACLADLNNDGWLDLIYTGVNASNNKVFLIFINQKNNTFLSVPNSIPGIRYGAIVCSDFNNNGWNDIFISGYSDSGTICKLYKNNGDLTFSPETQAFQGIYDGDIVAADFNNDALIDIMYSGYNSTSYLPRFFYYQNTGDFSFSQLDNSFRATINGDVEACDIDNDGYTDILLSGKDEDDNILTYVYKNNSGASFIYYTQVTGIQNGTVKTADFNMDGLADLFITGKMQSGDFTTELYLNDGSGDFILETDTLMGVANSAMNWFDFNLDNKLDIMYSGNSFAQAELYVLSSNIMAVNHLPQAPGNLNAAITNNNDSVVLSWNLASDNETTSLGISYDIYLFNALNGTSVFYPAVDTSSGVRKVNHMGSIKGNSILIKNLSEGKYIWSVQSVDAAFAGSPFSVADTFYITEPIQLGNDTTICYSDTINFSMLAVEGDFKWYHSLSPGAILSTLKEIEFEITQKDTIWVEVTKSYGDFLYDTIVVDVYSLPLVDLGKDTTICFGDTLSLTLGSEADYVNWNSLSGKYVENNTNNFIYPLYSYDEVYVELTDLNGCTNKDSISISVRTLPQINLVSDTALCINSTLQLNLGTALDSINWFSLTDFSRTLNSNAFEYLVSQNDTFQIEWYDHYRCVNYDTINIFARALPIADAGDDKLICNGYEIIIGPETIVPLWSYQWSGSENIINENTANPIVTPIEDTRYFLTVSDEYECIGSDSMLVKINPVGKLNVGADQSVCVGDSVMLGGNPTAEGSILPYSYKWNHENTLDNSILANPIASPTETITYSLIVYTGNCPVDTLETTVTVNPLPVISIMNDTIVGFKQDIILWVSGGESYEWFPQECLDNALSQNPVANIDQTTHFTVEVTDINTCKDTLGLTLFTKNEIFIPEMFSPNKDGINDFFKIYGFGFKQLHVLIFNQYGDVVFESSFLDEIQNIGWNGEYKGHQVENGKYFWKLEGEFNNGEKILFNGQETGVVTLLR